VRAIAYVDETADLLAGRRAARDGEIVALDYDQPSFPLHIRSPMPAIKIISGDGHDGGAGVNTRPNQPLPAQTSHLKVRLAY
jgi:hypothetical protein